MPTTITKSWLEKNRACEEQVELFAATYPEGLKLRPGALIEAAKNGLTVSWLKQFLPASAQRAYDEAVASALHAYMGARASAWRAYEEAEASAWRAYMGATASALEAHLEDLIAA